MVTRYANFEWKGIFLQLLSTTKVKLVDKMMQSAYLCVILHTKHKKLPFIAVLTRLLILGKIQDGDQCWWRHSPPAAPPSIKYTSSCWEDQRLPTEGKIVSKYCNISKTMGRGSTPPPSLYYDKDINLRVYARGLSGVVDFNSCACYCKH